MGQISDIKEAIRNFIKAYDDSLELGGVSLGELIEDIKDINREVTIGEYGTDLPREVIVDLILAVGDYKEEDLDGLSVEELLDVAIKVIDTL